MKGGVLFDPVADGYFVIVHTWDNPHCHGEPEEWRHPQVFPTEEAAMQFYKSSIRPELKRMMAEMEAKQTGTSLAYRSLEE